MRRTRTFREAATKYLTENLHKRNIQRDALDLRVVEPFIGDLALNRVHDGTLQDFIRTRLHRDRMAVGTVNRTLAVVRRVLSQETGRGSLRYRTRSIVPGRPPPLPARTIASR